MSIENTSAFTPEQVEAAVRQIAEASINAAIEKHGLKRSDLTQAQINEAYGYARQKVKDQQALDANPYYHLHKEELRKRELAETQLNAVKSSSARYSNETVTASVTASDARKAAGDFQWNHRMSANDKIAALGLDPSTVNRDEVRRLFGRGAKSNEQSDFHKANPKLYATYREVAKVLDIYGA